MEAGINKTKGPPVSWRQEAYLRKIAKLNQENRQLREERVELHDEIERLKRDNKKLKNLVEAQAQHLVGSSAERHQIRRVFDIGPQAAELLAMLYRRESVTKECAIVVLRRHDGADTKTEEHNVDTLLWRLRPKLQPFGIEIEMERGLGVEPTRWYLTPETRKKMRQLLKEDEQSHSPDRPDAETGGLMETDNEMRQPIQTARRRDPRELAQAIRGLK
jgi:hypothetical protein